MDSLLEGIHLMKSAEEVSRAGPSELGGEQAVACSALEPGAEVWSSRIWLVGFKYGCDAICFMT